jgi:predicted nucleic acid-binding protein
MSRAVLADTSIWVEVLARADARITQAFKDFSVHTHEMVMGELLLGFLPRGHAAVVDMQLLHRIPTLTHDDVVAFVRSHKLEGAGIGWIDAHLIAAAAKFGAELWTTDKPMSRAATKAGVPRVRV